MKKILSVICFLMFAYAGAQNHYVVTSANDPVNPFATVAGEFRWAIEQANASPGLDYIDFNIAGISPVVIQLNTYLPPITDEVIIDGNTQPASGTGTEPKIILNGSLIQGADGNYIQNCYNTVITNLQFESFTTSALVLFNAQSCSIKNNVFYASYNDGNNSSILFLGNCTANKIYGNRFGVNRALNTSVNNQPDGVRFDRFAGFGFPNGNFVGRPSLAERNYFYNSTDQAILAYGGYNNKLSGNIYIGNAANIAQFPPEKHCPEENPCKLKPVIINASKDVATGITSINGTTTSLNTDTLEIFLTNTAGIDALVFIGYAISQTNSTWLMTTQYNFVSGDKVIATATDIEGNTSPFSDPREIEFNQPCCVADLAVATTGLCPSTVPINIPSFPNQPVIVGSGIYSTCINKEFSLNMAAVICPAGNQLEPYIDFGDGSPIVNAGAATHAYAAAGTYYATFSYQDPNNPGCNTPARIYVLGIHVSENCCPETPFQIVVKGRADSRNCTNKLVALRLENATSCLAAEDIPNIQWTVSDGFTATGSGINHAFTSAGTYTITATINGTVCPVTSYTATVLIEDCTIDTCANCITSFAPIPGNTYLIGAWVREDQAPLTKTSFDYPQIFIDFPNFGSVGPFTATGKIIDGWQRVEASFVVPVGASTINIRLESTNPDPQKPCFFDDIRVFPKDGSMKSYVYDPETLRLVAELDERNYATFYEYDEEGKLARVKKETERGIMTIKEAKNSIIKRND